MTCSVLVWVAVLCGDQPSNDVFDLKQVVQANAIALQSVHSLRFHAQYFRNSGNTPTLIEDFRYVFDGQRERLTLAIPNIPKSEEGDPMGLSDIYADGSEIKGLIGYDPSNPPKLGEFSLSRASGYVRPKKQGQANAFSIDPKAMILFRVGLPGETRSLSDLVANSTSTRLTATPPNSPRKCYELAVERANSSFKISVDPAANFWIRRIEATHDTKLPGKSKPTRLDTLVEVKDFVPCNDGVFIPKSIHLSMTNEGSAPITSDMVVDEIVCNESVPEKMFEITFPDWLRVTDDHNGKVYIWGRDEKPRQTFDSYKDYTDWATPRFIKAKGLDGSVFSQARGHWIRIAVVLAVALGGVVLFLRHRRAART